MSYQFNPFVVSRNARFDKTKLLDHNQKFHESISIRDAQKIAADADMDLVCFKLPQKNEDAFCKILDFGKWKYHAEKEKKKQKQAQKIETKEIRFTPNISDNDIEHKLKQARSFLEHGDNVVFTMKMVGRQKQFRDLAKAKLDEIIDMCSDCGKEVSRSSTNNAIIVKLVKVTAKGE